MFSNGPPGSDGPDGIALISLISVVTKKSIDDCRDALSKDWEFWKEFGNTVCREATR